ncbi:hypothetical protein V8E53_009986 [Lactarius tabidus]
MSALAGRATDMIIPSPNTTNADDTYADVQLPFGWEERLTPDGRPYFVNHHTRTSTWTDPRLSSAMISALANRAALGPLPSGWEMCMTPTRKIYFVNHNMRTDMQDDPRLPTN